MKDKKFYKDLSDVEVFFKDGSVKTYGITASPSIGGYLIRGASDTGVLSLFNAQESYAIPLENIQEWRISAVPVVEAEEA